jgi:hypothetical protein
MPEDLIMFAWSRVVAFEDIVIDLSEGSALFAFDYA